MENFFSRYKNPLVLMAVLFVQFIALATQVKRAANPKAPNSAETPLIRVWALNVITPVERVFVSTGHFFRNTWHDYIDLHNVRKQNQALQDEIARLKLEQTRMKEDAEQAHRLQALLEFKQHYVGDVLPAQVIGASGSEHSRLIQIDKGTQAGVKADMAVITPDGIVGKVKDVTRYSSTVLLINDHESGAGVVLEKSRRQGVLRGAANGELNLRDIMSDEKIDIGEQVVTSGGDRIYPKGVPVGTVSSVNPDREDGYSLAIKIKPAVDLNRIEEVLVVRTAEEEPPSAGPAPQRAADILAERLPSIPKPDPNAGKPASPRATPAGQNAGTPTAAQKKPEATAPSVQNKLDATAAEPKKPAAPAAVDLMKPAAATGPDQKKPASEQKQEAKLPAEQKKAPSEQKKTAAPGPSLAPKPAGAEQPASGDASLAKPKPLAKPPKATVVPASADPSTQKPKVQTNKPATDTNRAPATARQNPEATKQQNAPPAETPAERPPR